MAYPLEGLLTLRYGCALKLLSNLSLLLSSSGLVMLQLNFWVQLVLKIVLNNVDNLEIGCYSPYSELQDIYNA